MINTLKRAALLVTAIFMVATPAFRRRRPTPNATPSVSSAAPTIKRIAPAFRRAARLRCNACRKTCRASRRAARARCVRSNRAGSAEGRVCSRCAPKPATAPRPRRRKPQPRPAAAPKAAASTPAKKPSDAQVAAIRSACRSDYQKVCAGVPTGGAPRCNAWKRTRQKSRRPARRLSARPAAVQRPRPARSSDGEHRQQRPPPRHRRADVMVLRPMRPREELFVLRSACSGDVRTLCGGVAPGGGRIMQCLATQAASISPACKDVLAQFAAQ